ncbi:MAG: hypothetical protein IJ946_01770, partial [Clostridia bacterium]|nr:hypothetical protein [Clostridia bacterium]
MNFSNNKYSVTFSENGSITSLIYNNKEFVGTILPLFGFMLRKGTVAERYTSNDGDAEIIKKDNCLSIDYTFKKPSISFKVDIEFGDRIEFSLSFVNNTGMYVEWVDYPQLAFKDDLVKRGGSGKLLMNINEGAIYDDFQTKERVYSSRYKELEYPSKGLYAMFPAVVESQFLAYYDDTAGIYVCAEDTERSIKGIDFAPEINDTIKIQFRLYPGIEPKNNEFTFSFKMVFDFFKGDWHDAAELYRRWFENNLPKNLEKIKNSNAIPEWYTDSPLVVAYPVQGIHDMDEAKPNRLFPYNNALPYLDEIAEETKSRILTALMHWESTAPWAPPYVWPPLGGEEMFKDFCSELHKRNHLLGVYCSGISYTVHSNINDYSCEKEIEENGLIEYMCAPPDGGAPISDICQAQRLSYDMCISQEFTKTVLVEEAKKIASSGLDYIQIFDQNHGGTPYFCYSEKHGHPAVPGKWMVEHNVKLLNALKEAVGDKVLLGCESASAEAYTPYLRLSDNRFNLNYSSGIPVPLYGYIYHEYLFNFSGNSVCSLFFIDSEKSPDCYLLRLAHSFIAGDLLTIVINQDGEIMWSWGQREFNTLPDRNAILSFIKSATAYKRGIGKKFLSYAKMIKPQKVFCESVEMYGQNLKYANKYPAVLTSAWVTDQGEKAQFFAAYRKQNELCRVDLSGIKCAKLIDENGDILNTFTGDIAEFTVPKCSVRMLAFE